MYSRVGLDIGSILLYIQHMLYST